MNTCINCHAIDADTEMGWSICRRCFRIDDPPQQRLSRWPRIAATSCIVMMIIALYFLALAVGTLSNAQPDCGIDAPGLCGELS